MLNKSSSKVLWIVLIVMVALFFILKYTDHSERTIRKELVSVDTAQIDNITIKSPKNKGAIHIRKKNNNWQVKEGDRYYNADNRKVRGILSQISELKPQSVVAKSSRQWDKYQVTDSLGTRIQFKKGEETKADLILGRINFKVPKTQSQNPYMRQQQEILMYARPYHDKSVYVTDGMVKLGLGNKPDDFREKLLCRLKPDQINTVTFVYTGGPSFTLKKEDNKWLLDGQPVDSATAAKYIHNFSYANGSKFINNFDPGSHSVTGKITVEQNGKESVVLTSYRIDSTKTVVHSSLNKESYFDGHPGKLFEKFFVSKNTFEKGGS